MQQDADDFIASAQRALDEVGSSILAHGPGDGKFRDNIPAYAAPDREEWERQHGVRPRRIVAAERFVNQAKTIIAGDWTTILRDRAISQHTKIEHVCERVKHDQTLGIGEDEHVFFDVQDGHFWVYPEA